MEAKLLEANVPAISSDPGIMQAAKDAIGIMLSFQGFPITLMRKGAAIAVPGGGHDFSDRVAIGPQSFKVTKLGDDIVEDGGDGDTPVVRRNFGLTGAFDADVAIDDIWSDDDNDYRVESVDRESGYKTVAEVTAFAKVG
jgi:hypothetical protein